MESCLSPYDKMPMATIQSKRLRNDCIQTRTSHLRIPRCHGGRSDISCHVLQLCDEAGMARNNRLECRMANWTFRGRIITKSELTAAIVNTRQIGGNEKCFAVKSPTRFMPPKIAFQKQASSIQERRSWRGYTIRR